MKKKPVFTMCCLVFIFYSCKKEDRPLIVSKIQAAAKMATTQVMIDKYIFASKEKNLLLGLITLNEAHYAAKSEATVKLGIDLNKIKKEDITVLDNSITILLPPVEVVNFSYPFEKFETNTLVSQDRFLNKITAYDIEEYFRQGETDIRENLDYMGLIEKTQVNTRRMLRMMLAGLGYTEIYIEYKPQQKLIGATLETEPEPEQ
ncbi:MAG TPA: DUF4230 domain-containing protein [Chryseolinea sp.]|nr:DUF4230 domain-containing protein [Chryseolinea sp.]